VRAKIRDFYKRFETLGVNSDPTRGCTGKQKFKTYGQAERVAKMVRNHKDGRAKVYKCKACQLFHFASRMRKQLTKRRYEIQLGALVEDGE
jgi:hypothetical protein